MGRYQDKWTNAELIQQGDTIGYPLMVKASAGGGGRGIRKVNDSSDLAETIAVVQTEVEKFLVKEVFYLNDASPKHVILRYNWFVQLQPMQLVYAIVRFRERTKRLSKRLLLLFYLQK